MPTLGIPYAPAALRNGRPVDVCPICCEVLPGVVSASTNGSRYFLHYSAKHNGVAPTREQSAEAHAIAKRMLNVEHAYSHASAAATYLERLSGMHEDGSIPGPLCDLLESALDAWDAFKSALDAEAS